MFIIKFMSKRFQRKAKHSFNKVKILVLRKIFNKISKAPTITSSTNQHSKATGSIKISFKEETLLSSSNSSCGLFIPAKTFQKVAHQFCFSSFKINGKSLNKKNFVLFINKTASSKQQKV